MADVLKPTRKAVQTKCPQRTIGGTCKCRPKCKHCGWGPHMAVHMGTKADPALAYDHEYEPIAAQQKEAAHEA